MELWGADPLVYPSDTAPVGPEGHCTWCRQPHGTHHENDCPVLNRRRYNAAPREWLPLETYIEGYHALLYFPKGEKGVGGIEAATAYRDEGRLLGGWTHGGPNSGSDFDFCEEPTYWMPLPAPPTQGS